MHTIRFASLADTTLSILQSIKVCLLCSGCYFQAVTETRQRHVGAKTGVGVTRPRFTALSAWLPSRYLPPNSRGISLPLLANSCEPSPMTNMATPKRHRSEQEDVTTPANDNEVRAAAAAQCVSASSLIHPSRTSTTLQLARERFVSLSFWR